VKRQNGPSVNQAIWSRRSLSIAYTLYASVLARGRKPMRPCPLDSLGHMFRAKLSDASTIEQTDPKIRSRQSIQIFICRLPPYS
jgi:hypothetical protein